MPIRISVKDRVEEYESECNGRNSKGKEVFDIPVEISITVSGDNSNPTEAVSVDVKHCPYNYGESGNYCRAAHPHISEVERTVTCPYAISLPCGKSYIAENKKRRMLVNKDLAEIASEKDSLLHPYRKLFE